MQRLIGNDEIYFIRSSLELQLIRYSKVKWMVSGTSSALNLSFDNQNETQRRDYGFTREVVLEYAYSAQSRGLG